LKVKAEEGITVVMEQKRRLLSKRHPDGASSPFRRLKKDKKQDYTNVCVEWKSTPVLSASTIPTPSHNIGQARVACGSNLNPGTPSTGLGTSRLEGSSIKLGTAWTLNTKQVKDLPADQSINPAAIQGTRVPGTPNPTAQLTKDNTVTRNGKLYSCNPGTNKVGCLEIYFKKAAPPKAAMLGEIASGGKMTDNGWQAPPYWLCSGAASENNVQKFCPSRGSPCDAKSFTMDGMIAALKASNSTWTMIIRICGFFCFWLSVSACLQPIRSVLGLFANMADGATDCIPCVGSIVDLMTDIFMGVVKAILCVVSFCCAGAMFLTVVVVMWIVMKPWFGIPLCCVSCMCWAGAGYLLHSNRRSAKGGGDDEISREESEMGNVDG
jgi:hypothetical protein